MAAIARRSVMAPVSRIFTLATADDINGVQDGTRRAENTGTAGTAGIDVVSISKDGGKQWSPATDGLAIDSDDSTGTVLVSGALNAAGVEPVNAAVFKFGPYEGPTAIRVFRYVTDEAASAAWVTGAPKVFAFTIGQTAGTPVVV